MQNSLIEEKTHSRGLIKTDEMHDDNVLSHTSLLFLSVVNPRTRI